MRDGKFKSLIIDTYKKYKADGNLSGILYGAISTYGFSQIVDIEGFVESSSADMLYLKSALTGVEVDIYEFDLVDYQIKSSENTIYVKLRNKEISLMY